MFKMRQWNKFWVTASACIFFLFTRFSTAEAKCSRLPSGNCWVNCNGDAYDIICNNVTAESVQSDIDVFSGINQLLRLNIWASPAITRLSADVFSGVASQIISLDLQDVVNLNTFPEVYELNHLRRLSIWNSPQLCTLTTEMLPRNLWKIALSKVCISSFENDFFEVPSLPNLGIFVLRNLTINIWQDNFLTLFPSLVTFEITNSVIDVRNYHSRYYTSGVEDSSKYLNNVTDILIHKNRIASNTSHEFVSGLLDILTRSDREKNSSRIDLTANNMLIDDKILGCIGRLNDSLVSLSLRKNFIADNSTLDATLASLNKLQFLDLGTSQLYSGDGFLKSLASLSTLKLDNNLLYNMADVDAFDGSKSTNLTTIDMSYNNLKVLPFGNRTFVGMASQLINLSLRGNNLQIFQSNKTELLADSYDGEMTAMALFRNLETLDLSRNNFTTFYGLHLTPLTKLRSLDLSCNSFPKVHKYFFEGLPKSLKQLNFSLCQTYSQSAPLLDIDVFSTLPPLEILILNAGSYKKWIFTLFNLTNETSNSLKELHLADNYITYLDMNTVPSLPSLEVLNLDGNFLQSITPGSFSKVPKLKTLKLSRNKFSSLSSKTFSDKNGQLQNLENLDLSHNEIARITRGAFDKLPKLRSLFLGWNPTEIQDVFFDGGKELRYLGIQDYNISCLKPEFFQQLPQLRWVLPDVYNLILVDPDSRLMKRDEYLLSIINICITGAVVPDHEFFPGLKDFVSVTIHDADVEGDPVQYPILSAFLPLNYCPADNYVTKLNNIICAKPPATFSAKNT